MPGQDKPLILYLDNDNQLRQLIVASLWPCRIICCETTAQFLLTAKRDIVRLYLLDLDRPGGSDLCQRIRQFDPNTPIIVTSLDDSDGAKRHMLFIDGDAFWSKRQSTDLLKLMIENHLHRSTIRSFAARRSEYAAIREELERQREEARAQKEEAKKIRLNCQRRRVILTAYRAFAKHGGTRAEFNRMWPDVYAEATD